MDSLCLSCPAAGQPRLLLCACPLSGASCPPYTLPMTRVPYYPCGLAGCMLCYCGRKARSYFKGHFGWRRARVPYKEPPWMLRRRERETAGSGPLTVSYDAGPWAKTYPTVVEFLTSSTWEDGSARETGTLTIMAEGGLFKCSIRDRAQGIYAFLSGRTPGDLLASLEKALVADSLEWRVDKPASGRKK